MVLMRRNDGVTTLTQEIQKNPEKWSTTANYGQIQPSILGKSGQIANPITDSEQIFR